MNATARIGQPGPTPGRAEEWLRAALQEVEGRLDAACEGSGALEPMLRHLRGVPGKRIRARLVLAWASLRGRVAASPDAVTAAAAVELIHEASLAHDDICDAGLLRRGAPSLAAAFGIRTASLAGAFLAGRGLSMLAELSERAGIPVDFEVLRRLSEGQVLEALPGTDSLAADRKRYLDVVRRKTSSLFLLACDVGARLCEAQSGVTVVGEPSRTFGDAFGLAFQLIDDVLDLEAPASLGKAEGADLSRGLLTWPLLDWAAAQPDPQKARARLLAAGQADADREQLRRELLASGACCRTRELIASTLERAAGALEGFELSPAKSTLLHLLEQVESR